MARGNVGNLLQHFLAIHAAERLVGVSSASDRPAPSLCYIDPFAMAPWEEIQGKRPEGFVSMVRSLPTRPDDPVARTLLSAWARHYASDPGGVPTHPVERDYPNTAVLLRERFPDVSWDMRLCEIDRRRRDGLREWASEQAPGAYLVGGDWHESEVLAPIAEATPALVMLDPYQVVADDAKKAGRLGYLTATELRQLLDDRLRILKRPTAEAAAPATVVLLSFADTDPDTVDGRVQGVFARDRWWIDRVRVGPFQGRHGASFHQGWLCHSHELASAGPTIQDRWDAWRRSLRRGEADRRRRLLPDLTFYVQGRADGGLRCGVETPDDEIFHILENEAGLDRSDPRLIWSADVRCQGPGVPRTSEAASRWFAEHSDAFRDGIALVARDLDVGLDPDIYPLVREIPGLADGVVTKVVVFVSRRREGLMIRAVLDDVIARWDDLMSSLGVVRPARA
jgi:hypothetical protein